MSFSSITEPEPEKTIEEVNTVKKIVVLSIWKKFTKCISLSKVWMTLGAIKPNAREFL